MADGPMTPETTNLPSRLEQDATRGRDITSPGMDYLAQSQAMLWSCMIDVADAMKSFSQSRQHATVNTCKLLISCQHPMELAALHQKHAQDAMAQYQE